MTRRKNAKTKDEIDRNLKRAFDALADAPLPERFTTLLDKLKAEGADQAAPSNPKSEDPS